MTGVARLRLQMPFAGSAPTIRHSFSMHKCEYFGIPPDTFGMPVMHVMALCLYLLLRLSSALSLADLGAENY